MYRNSTVVGTVHSCIGELGNSSQCTVNYETWREEVLLLVECVSRDLFVRLVFTLDMTGANISTLSYISRNVVDPDTVQSQYIS